MEHFLLWKVLIFQPHFPYITRKKRTCMNKTLCFVKRNVLCYTESNFNSGFFQVYQFIRFVSNKLLKGFFCTCEKNYKLFLHAVRKVIYLGRYESLAIERMMIGVKISRFVWIHRNPRLPVYATKSRKDRKTVAALWLWLFNHFIIPVLRGFFYVTESSAHKQKVFYYRKPVWSCIRNVGVQSLLNSTYCVVPVEDVKEKLRTKECLGVYDVRLIPGPSKVICNQLHGRYCCCCCCCYLKVVNHITKLFLSEQ